MPTVAFSPAEAFDIRTPLATTGPLVFASPHSGMACPDDFGLADGLTQVSLRSAEDAMVDQLIATGTDHGVPVIAGRISRAYVDLNRAAGELDPALIDDVVGGDLSAKTAAGFGVIPRRAGDGAALYDRRLSLAEAQARLEAVHRPYHAALTGLLEAARAQHGLAVLIDWHSMPSLAAGDRTGGQAGNRRIRGVDVVLGDRHGSSCDARLTRRLRSLFEAAGWRVGLNIPYAGGYSTQTWGRPGEGFHAVQIELNRSLYLDETTLEPTVGFARCKTVLDRVIAAVAHDPWGEG